MTRSILYSTAIVLSVAMVCAVLLTPLGPASPAVGASQVGSGTPMAPADPPTIHGSMATGLTHGHDNETNVTTTSLSVLPGSMVILWGQNDWTPGTQGPVNVTDSAGGTYVQEAYQQSVGGPGWGSGFVYERGTVVPSGVSSLTVTVNWSIGTNAQVAALDLVNFAGVSAVGPTTSGATTTGAVSVESVIAAQNATATVLMMASSDVESTEVQFGPGQSGTSVQLATGEFEGNQATLAFSTQRSTAGLVSSNLTFVPSQYNAATFATDIIVYSPAERYVVSFVETGLLSGTTWGVTLGGVSESANTSTITYDKVNGTYDYSVAGVAGWTASSYSGSLTVSASSVTVGVNWAVTTYAVDFTETGLPTGTPWFVNVTGGSSYSSSTALLTFQEPNGSYGVGVSTGANYVAIPPNETLLIHGASVSETAAFAETFRLTFDRPSGTPVGATWTVFLNATSQSSGARLATAGAGGDVVQSTTGPTLSIFAVNGTYLYTILVAGNPSLASQGTVSVQGAPQVVNAPASPSTFLGFTGATGYYILIGIVVAIIVVIVVVVILLARHRAPPPAPKGDGKTPP